jgi:hypothetical protein
MPSGVDNSPDTPHDSTPGFPWAAIDGVLDDRLQVGHLPGAWTTVPAPVDPASYDRWLESLPPDVVAPDASPVTVLITDIPPLEAVTDPAPPVTSWGLLVTPLTIDQLRQIAIDHAAAMADIVPLTADLLKEICE